MWLYSLKIHFNFVKKSLNEPDNRLVCITAREVVNQNTSWFTSWNLLVEQHGVSEKLDLANIGRWSEMSSLIIEKIRSKHLQDCLIRAQQSDTFLLYRELDHSLSLFSMNCTLGNCIPLSSLRWFFKLRCELVYLNYLPWKEDNSIICSLCNCKVREDVIHFLAECSILSEFRLFHLNRQSFSRNELVSLLNGSDFQNHVNYVKQAWPYRYQLVQYFNI